MSKNTSLRNPTVGSLRDHDFVACKVIRKEGLDERRRELIENEIIN